MAELLVAISSFAKRSDFRDCYRYLLHDRDSIVAMSLEESFKRRGLIVRKSSPHDPKANAI